VPELFLPDGKREGVLSGGSTRDRGADIERAVSNLDAFDASVASTGVPEHPPVPVGSWEIEWVPFEDPYYVRIGCSVRPSPVWTSDDQEAVNKNRNAASFGDPCSDADRDGRYTHPETLKVIVVPHAGCARFWIEVEFGKSLFPPIEDRLDLAAVEFVALAEDVFGTRFLQGCSWG
jgi:hypothetical protein